MQKFKSRQQDDILGVWTILKPGRQDGVYGDPRRATVELGQLGVQRIVETSVNAIRAALREHEDATINKGNKHK